MVDRITQSNPRNRGDAPHPAGAGVAQMTLKAFVRSLSPGLRWAFYFGVGLAAFGTIVVLPLAMYYYVQGLSRGGNGSPYPLLLLAFAMVAFWVQISITVRSVPRPGHCVKCGYSLMGLTEQRCPECGRPFTFKEVRQTPQELMFGGSPSDDIKNAAPPPPAPALAETSDRQQRQA